MKIALVQHNILWSAKQANLEKIRSLIDSAPGADVYVLPEMFATGFSMKPERIAEPYPGEVVAWMIDLARDKSAAIIGSVSVEKGGNYYNRLIMAKPGGAVEYYDKRHLFSFAGEDGKYACGKERKVFEFRGVRFLPLVCYDLRFPVWSRNHSDYDVAIYVASWPDERKYAWQTLLRARAIENQCYVLGVNRVGSDPVSVYSGYSVALGPDGMQIAECEPGKEVAVIADIDMEILGEYRKKYPFLRDADWNKDDFVW